MSKDIRSYFTANSSTRHQKSKSNVQKSVEKVGQRKRPVLIIDSDSDEESSKPPVVKRSKSSTVDDKNANGGKNEDKKTTSKYFLSETAASDVFGAKPVKRDNARNIVKKTLKKEVDEFHIDKVFETELLKFDDIDLDTLSNNTSGPKVQEKSCKDVSNGEIRENTLNLEERQDSIIQSELSCKNVKMENEHNSPDFKKLSKSKKEKEITKNTISEKNNKSPSKASSSNTVSSRSPIEEFLVKNSPSKKLKPTNLSYSKKSPLKKLSIHSEKDQSQKDFLNKIDKTVESPALHKISPVKSKDIDCKLSKKSLPPKDIHNIVKVAPKINHNCLNKKQPDDIKCSLNPAYYLWVEKYKPISSKQIIGQQGDKSCVNKLSTWLKNWYKNQSGNKKLLKPSPWAKNDDGRYFKAALLSGPPGIGKTTTAHIVSKDLGFDVVEFNASDTRSKKLLHQEVSELLSTNSLSTFFTGKGEQVTKKHVLLMDEVDGMAGNEDRGGVQELIQLIKQSKIPIICMCNDRNHPKIRSLANYCFDLRFSKPRIEQIRGAMMSVCFKEKLKMTPDVLTEIIKSANQDIRLVINHLSMLAVENSNLANSSKFIKMGPWDVLRKIFSKEEHKAMSIDDKCALFFHDYSVNPLFVQENYLNAVPHDPKAKNKIKKMELFASAARSLSLGDLTEKNIRSLNAWSLLPVQAIFSSLVPGEILEGHVGAQINFPAWFGKNSRQTKMSRLLQELTVHSRLKISGNKESMNLDYLVPLEKSIIMPLVKQGSDGIPQALSVLNEYCLVREDLESISELSSWPNMKNQFSEVESKVKAAFTRAYNKTSVPTPYAAVPIKKSNKTDIDNSEFTNEKEEEVVEELEDDEEEDNPEVDAMIVVKKKPLTKKADKEMPSTSKRSKKTKK